jgi:hypothetical protein
MIVVVDGGTATGTSGAALVFPSARSCNHRNHSGVTFPDFASIIGLIGARSVLGI